MSKVEDTKTVSEKDETAAVGVSIQTVCGSGPDAANYGLQTHFPIDLPALEMDRLLDKLSDRLARQRIIAEIPKHQEDIKRGETAIRKIVEDRERLDKMHEKEWKDSGRTGKFELSKANKQAREQNAIEVKNWQERIAESKGLLKVALRVKAETEKSEKGRKTA